MTSTSAVRLCLPQKSSISCVPPPPKNVKPFQVMMSKLPEFLDVDKMKVEVIGKEKEKLTEFGALEPRQESHLDDLTGRQRQALITAYSLGY
jgi:hypothetical protein